MTTEQIIAYAIGLGIGIIGYFLRNVMTDLRTLKDRVDAHHTSIELLKNNHLALEKRMDQILDLLNELKSDIKELRKDINK